MKKISIPRDSLLIPLQQCVGIIEKRQTFPILSNILFIYEEGKLSISATDLEISIETVCFSITSEEDCRFTLPAKKCLDICRSLPNDSNIDIFLEEHRAVVKSNKSRFTLATLPAENYPHIEQINSIHQFSVEENKLKKLVESVSFCMSIQDVRFYLNGLLLELRNDSIRTVATDGHRIAVNEIVSDEFSALTEHYQLIIPRKAILELLRLLNDSDEKINVCIDQNHIRFDLPSLSFTSKLIDGRYPNYERALYIRGEKEIILQKESFRAALQRAAILSHENHHGIKIVLSENTLVIISNNAEREEAKEIVEINYGFETLELGFNGQYVLEIVSAIQTDEFKVTISDTNGSFLVEFDHESYKNLKYIIMPMKI
ncbi:MAG: DNA polymerase III subunit beta [Methylococcales bacterium]|jgi:DNA polymerase III subunit beta|nr:DNA polymerase III subunit beta [Methylococcales bacterium]MBT7411314.1 DNA polymerase III subunit beta [Methylococcales bacterium]